jgi:hypothetical protein
MGVCDRFLDVELRSRVISTAGDRHKSVANNGLPTTKKLAKKNESRMDKGIIWRRPHERFGGMPEPGGPREPSPISAVEGNRSGRGRPKRLWQYD